MKNCVFFIFSGIVMYGFLQLIENIAGIHFYSLIFEIVVGAFIYLTMCLIYFIMRKNEVVLNKDYFESFKKLICDGMYREELYGDLILCLMTNAPEIKTSFHDNIGVCL